MQKDEIIMCEKIKDEGELILKLKEFGKYNYNLEKHNPYLVFDDDGINNDNYAKLNSIIKDFLSAYDKKIKEFSWPKKLNELNTLNKVPEGMNFNEDLISANINYGLPSHINGDYLNGIIYHCLFNPGSNNVKDERTIKEYSLKEYYDIPNKEKEDGKPIGPDDINQMIQDTKKDEIIDILRENIIGYDSMLTKEIKRKRNGGEKGYYINNYYKYITDKFENDYFHNAKYSNCFMQQLRIHTNKLVNLELYPLKSLNKQNSKYKINSFSLFGAYIILFRIGKYLNNENEIKPIFVFRSFKEWKEIIIRVLLDEFKADSYFVESFFDNYLYDKFFYEFSSQRGHINPNNVIKKTKIDESTFNELIGALHI